MFILFKFFNRVKMNAISATTTKLYASYIYRTKVMTRNIETTTYVI